MQKSRQWRRRLPTVWTKRRPNSTTRWFACKTSSTSLWKVPFLFFECCFWASNQFRNFPFSIFLAFTQIFTTVKIFHNLFKIQCADIKTVNWTSTGGLDQEKNVWYATKDDALRVYRTGISHSFFNCFRHFPTQILQAAESNDPSDHFYSISEIIWWIVGFKVKNLKSENDL